jgi:NAD(P)-dependent dehydrogenase (short-subunit alcohol dehydrogenase family)
MITPQTARRGRPHWTAADTPDQAGRVAVITGASNGIGMEIARVLASRGARLVLACRDVDKGRAAADRIGAALSGAGAGPGGVSADVVELDLSSLASVRAGAAAIRASYPRLDLLINNAGVMEVPYQQTADGFELTFATNHLGHFALTGLLLESLLAAPDSRIVTMSSQGHVDGVMNFADLQSEQNYDPARAYHQSKLANLLFTYELDRQLRSAAAATLALGAHPGVVYTDLFKHRSPLQQMLISPRARPVNFWAVQSVQQGALPALRAGTDPSAESGEYYGPHRRHDTGYPVPVESSPRSRDVADQARLWQVSQELTGVSYPLKPRIWLP